MIEHVFCDFSLKCFIFEIFDRFHTFSTPCMYNRIHTIYIHTIIHTILFSTYYTTPTMYLKIRISLFAYPCIIALYYHYVNRICCKSRISKERNTLAYFLNHIRNLIYNLQHISHLSCDVFSNLRKLL